MYDTRNIDAIALALLELTGCLNSPRQDDVLLSEAKVSLDRALFPLLVRLSVAGSIGVAKLADQAGRDPSTVSRQLAKLEELGYIKRPAPKADARLREATITKAGERTVLALREARWRLLGKAIEGWTKEERQLLPELLERLTLAMRQAQRATFT